MSFKLDRLFPGCPNTERGRPVFIKEHPKGRFIVFGSGRCCVLLSLEDPKKNEIVIKHKEKVTAVSYQPAGYFVASGDKVGNLNIWSTENVDHTSRLEIQPMSNVIYDIDWTADSKRVITVGKGKDELGKVFQWDTGAAVGKITGHADEILSVAMKPQRPFRIATAGADNWVGFFKGPPFKLERQFKKHESFVNCVRYSPDGSQFGTVSTDKVMYFFDGKTGEMKHELKGGHRSSVYGIAFSPDSKQFLTCSGDKSVKLWNAEDYSELKSFVFDKEVEDIKLGVHWSAAHGPICVNLAGDLIFLDLDNPNVPKRVISGHNKQITDLVRDGESGHIFTSSMDGVIRWDLENGSLGRVRGRQPKNGVNAIDILGDEIVIAGFDKNLYFVEKEKMTFRGGTKLEVDCLVNDLSVFGDMVFCGTKKGLLVLKNKKVVAQIETELPVLCLDVFENTVVVGHKDRHGARIAWYEFDGSSFKFITQNTEDHKGAPSVLKFNQDGTMLASGDTNNEIFVWDTVSKGIKYEDLVHHAQKITFLDWADDKKTLMSCSQDKTIKIWNLEAKTRISVLAHQLGCAVCKFVGSDKLVSMGQDFVFKVWDVEM